MLTYDKDFAEFVQRSAAGERLEIDEEMFGYWLDVLPPVYMARTVELPLQPGDAAPVRVRASFGFAEGAESITAFWTTRRPGETTRYFAQRTAEKHRG